MQNHQYSVKLAGVRCRFNPNVFGSVYELALRKLAKPSEAEPKKLPGGRKLGERLKLVLDLDNTLLNAVSTAKLNVGEVDLNDFVVDGSPQMYLFSLPQLPEQRFLLKLRPYVHEFLAEVSKSCELSIHTNATREYADVVLAVLDPDRSYFGGRVVARDQSGSNDQKKDLDRLYESSSSNGDILILDDRTDVWDDTLQSNIIRCAFYGYLEHHKENFSRRYGRRSFLMANQLLSTSAFADHDQQLTYLATMITKVARRYQESALNGEPLHVRALLRDVSSKILAPSRVLLTGFNKSAQKSTFGFHDSGPRFRLKLTALGAEVVDDPEDSSITHIVVMRQTNTTTRAIISFLLSHDASSMNPDAHVVHSLWALACETLWTKVDESQFALPKMPRSWVGSPSTFPDYDIFVPLAETNSASPYTSDLDQSGSDPDENPPAKRFKHAETPSIPIVEWEGSGPWSNGAEVWSPHRRTLLLYQEQRRGPSERPAIVEPRLAQVST